MDWTQIWQQNAGDRLTSGPSTRSRLRLMLALVSEYSRPGATLLDVGCGTGELLAGVAKLRRFKRLVGVDISELPLERARRAVPDAELGVLDICESKLAEQFDVVTCMMTLDLVPDEERAMQHLAQMLKPGGHLLVVVQHLQKFASPLDLRYGVRRHERETLVALGSRHGLEPVALYTWGFPLFNTYYSLLNAGASDAMGMARARSWLFRTVSDALVRIFVFDDLFKGSARGRILLGAFRKR